VGEALGVLALVDVVVVGAQLLGFAQVRRAEGEGGELVT
jgi:hypothetical protein